MADSPRLDRISFLTRAANCLCGAASRGCVTRVLHTVALGCAPFIGEVTLGGVIRPTISSVMPRWAGGMTSEYRLWLATAWNAPPRQRTGNS